MRWSGGPVRLTILGQPCSLKNSRDQIPNPRAPGKWISVPGKTARQYLRDFNKQAPILQPLIECDVSVTIRIFYSWNGPDLDEALILDAMQKRIYKNDRQVREKHVYHAIDKDNPRAEIIVAPREGALFQAAGVAA